MPGVCYALGDGPVSRCDPNKIDYYLGAVERSASW